MRNVHIFDFSNSSKAWLLNSIFHVISSSQNSTLITVSVRTLKALKLAVVELLKSFNVFDNLIMSCVQCCFGLLFNEYVVQNFFKITVDC